jgi:hypothetical protein
MPLGRLPVRQSLPCGLKAGRERRVQRFLLLPKKDMRERGGGGAGREGGVWRRSSRRCLWRSAMVMDE